MRSHSYKVAWLEAIALYYNYNRVKEGEEKYNLVVYGSIHAIRPKAFFLINSNCT